MSPLFTLTPPPAGSATGSEVGRVRVCVRLSHQTLILFSAPQRLHGHSGRGGGREGVESDTPAAEANRINESRLCAVPCVELLFAAVTNEL